MSSPEPSPAEEPASAHAPAAAEMGRAVGERAGRIRSTLRPWLHQVWINMRVWVPFLLNPSERERQIRYWARESCEGRTWRIALPNQCWWCGTTEALRSREYRREVRGFEYPLLIVATALGAALFLLLFSGWAALIALLLGGVGVVVKSWTEDVRLVISTCSEHADELRCPDMVVDQGELHVYAPTHQLATAAVAELKAARRQAASTLGQPGGGGRSLSISSTGEPPLGPPPPPPRPGSSPSAYAPRSGPAVPDLPPIKLAGDEDEPPADSSPGAAS